MEKFGTNALIWGYKTAPYEQLLFGLIYEKT